jgi:anti-sigma regulatory factor (Ser/Thr protein kinase)
MPQRPVDTMSVRLAPGATAPRSARAAVQRALAGADPQAVERAMLLTSELVTNAVVHAATPLRLTLAIGRQGLRVEVADLDCTPPVPVPESQSGPHGGFGLHIVERLASAWGCTRHDDGKTVWFEMPLRVRDDGADTRGREMQDA